MSLAPWLPRALSLRARMGLAAGVAVAMAVIAVAVSAYAGTRSDLRSQVDNSLQTLSQGFLARSRTGAPPRRGGPDDPAAPSTPAPGQSVIPSRPSLLGFTGAGDCDAGLGLDSMPGSEFGGPRGYVQVVRRSGQVCLPHDESVAIPVSATVARLAARGTGQFASDVTAHSIHLRVLTVGMGYRGALMVALPLDGVRRELSRELIILLLIAAGGTALAAVLGVLVARTALAPIARFTRQTEAIAKEPDTLDRRRLEVSGQDELARLGATFNATLDALADSIRAQRNLVADASHELRTPIASVRANLQLMRDADLLPPADRKALRADIIAELDELTALVADVVELARGSDLTSERGDLRLDEIVADAVARARRRAPHLVFEAALEPTVIEGDGERIARAVSNLLDNATKWSPDGEAVEVALHDGVLLVRDHGPGFGDADLSHVFDRFHRAAQARATPGSGLGLAIVRQAAEAHGGRAQAADAPGGGALLRVSFGPPLDLGSEPVAGAGPDSPGVESSRGADPRRGGHPVHAAQ